MPKPPVIILGQIAQLERGPFRIVSYGKGCFLIRNERTGDEELIHHLELARQLAPGTSLEREEARPEPLTRTLGALNEDAMRLAPHLQEILDGTPVAGEERRAEYDESVPITRRMARKLKELEEVGLKMSEATLKRRLRRYREIGVAGLSDRRSAKPNAPLSRIDEGVEEIVVELLDGYKGRSSVTYTSIRADVKRVLYERYPEADERPRPPSLSTVIRMVKRLAGDQDPTRSAARRETDALVPKRAFRPRGASAPGDECQVDTTVFDAFVQMPDGKIARPYLTVLLDRKTRSILSHAFTVGPPTGYDHALLLANALVPRRARSWNDAYASLGLDEMPWAKHLSAEQRAAFDAHRPYIFPRRILIDNGQDYRSLVFRAACERYGISLTESPPQSPTSKAHVERNFGTINSKFAQFLPGYVGGSIAMRGANAAKDKAMQLHEVDDLFDRWAAIVWQNREHAGLRDLDEPTLLHTPNSMFMASIEITGHFTVALQEDDFIALMPSQRRVVQTDGISFNSRTYDSPHLFPYRRQKGGDGTPVQVDVHFDPTDRNQVWVRGNDGAWITCGWTALPGMRRPMNSELMQRTADFSKASITFDDEQADDLVLRLRTDVLTESEARRRAEREDQRRVRQAQQRAVRSLERQAARDAEADDDGYEFDVA